MSFWCVAAAISGLKSVEHHTVRRLLDWPGTPARLVREQCISKHLRKQFREERYCSGHVCQVMAIFFRYLCQLHSGPILCIRSTSVALSILDGERPSFLGGYSPSVSWATC